MRTTTFALLLAFAPGVIAAQTEPAGPTESKPQTAPPSGFSAETRVRLEATLRVAREQGLPTGPLADRIAEGQAKGASETQIVAATRQLEARLEASHQALVRAGRPEPSDAEVSRGAQVLEQGATGAQLEAFVRQQPSGRRLEVAFQVLTDLAARGVPVDRALAVVGANLNGSAGIDLNRPAAAGKEPPAGGLTGTLSSGLGVGLTRKP